EKVQLFARDDASGRSYRCGLSGAPGSTTVRWSGVTGFALVDADAGAAGALRIPFRVGDWSGLLVLADPAPEVDGARAARFISRTAADIVPALVSRGAVAALKERATRHERARLERQLHDRVIQSLIAAEMSVAAFGRRAAATAQEQHWPSELARVQHLLHQEILGLRDFMRELKPLDVHPDQLAAVIEESVDRFARETGIAATFTHAGSPAALPRRACAGIVRIVQEALTNVRKHSGAETVRVRLGSTPTRA